MPEKKVSYRLVRPTPPKKRRATKATKPARAPKKPPRTPSRREPLLVDWPREPGLEAAIIAAPLDPLPRMVYADWLQAAGDLRGEWMAIHAAIENDPANVRLRSLMVELLGKHRKALLAGGHRLLPGAWIGWRGGFIDEIRVQPLDELRDPLGALRELLAHPICRFVRRIGFGEFRGLEKLGEMLVEAALPLLETVVAVDASYRMREADTISGDWLAELPALRRLGIQGVAMAAPLPRLVELTAALGVADDWISGGHCTAVEDLTLDCAYVNAPARQLYEVIGALPKLRRLRLLHVENADPIVGNLQPLAGQLELLDLSYSSVTDAGAAPLAKWPNLTLVACRTALSDGMVARLTSALPSVTHSRRGEHTRYFNDRGEDGSWLHHRLATEGRDALITLPGVGSPLYSLGTNHSLDGRARRAVPLLDASLTFPTASLKTWAWANAAIAHERLLELDEAELIAREGLIRTPTEPNLYAIVVDALRRSGQLARALALLPEAIDSISAKPGIGAHAGGPAACLADCLLVFAQAGMHDQVLALAGEFPELVDSRTDMFATIAMSQVALGKVSEARASLKLDDGKRFVGLHAHARAVLALAGKRVEVARAVAAIEAAKAAGYPEWHWIATDPNLARLRDVPDFQALIATPPAPP